MIFWPFLKIILEIPNTVLKDKILKITLFENWVNLLAKAAKSSIFLLRTYTLRPPPWQLKNIFFLLFSIWCNVSKLCLFIHESSEMADR